MIMMECRLNTMKSNKPSEMPCLPQKCKPDPNYHDGDACGTPYCSWSETRCLVCRWYYIECGCHSMTGYGKINEKRYRKILRNKCYSK